MAPAFDDAPALQHQDLVGMADGGKPVGDDEAGAVLHEPVERLLDEAFGGVVHAGRGLVENENRRIFQQGAGNGKSLFFTDAELYPAFAQWRVEGLRQAADECCRRWPLLSASHISFSVASGFPMRRFSAVVPLKRKLSWVTMAMFSRRNWRGKERRRPAVEKDLAALEFVKTDEQVHDGRFSCTGRTDQRDHLAGTRVKIDVLQHRELGSVGKGNVPILHIAAQRRGGMPRHFHPARLVRRGFRRRARARRGLPERVD